MLFLAPVLVWALWLGYIKHGQSKVSAYFLNPNGMTWVTKSGRFKVSVTSTREAETEKIHLRIIEEKANRVVYDRELEIDWDMGGGGFLKAMQADNDPEPEIVFVTKSGKDNFYLDFSSEGIHQKPFSRASEQAKALAADWLRYHAPNTFMVGLALVVTGAYYFIGFPLYWAIRWFVRKYR